MRSARTPIGTLALAGAISLTRGRKYFWVRYVDTVDDGAKALAKKPRHAYVEKVYEDGDFSGLGV